MSIWLQLVWLVSALIIWKQQNQVFNPFFTGNPQTGTLANSEDPDEMQLDAAFHLGLHCLMRLKQTSLIEIQSNFGCSNLSVSNTMDCWNSFVSPGNFPIYLMWKYTQARTMMARTLQLKTQTTGQFLIYNAWLARTNIYLTWIIQMHDIS